MTPQNLILLNAILGSPVNVNCNNGGGGGGEGGVLEQL